MSTNEENPVESQEDDLDTFSAEFFGQKTAPTEQASSEEKDEDALEDSDANKEDTQDGEDDTPAPEDVDDEEAEDEDQDNDEDDPEPEPKPKKTRAQERIEELNTKFRETERRLNEALARLEKQNEVKPKPEPVKVEVDTGPLPDDKNEDGSDKYALGEFDPQYIRDLTRHTLHTEREAMKAQEQAETVQSQMEEQRAALQAEWEGKLGPAQERYPDFMDKGQDLLSKFDGIDPAYGEYLTSTIMSLENGHDVLYYLANHQDEADKIVNSGAAKATIALGRLDARFVVEEKQPARPKVTKAPTPPAHMNKGSAAAIAEVPADTDDLEAFANEFFSKKKRRS